MGSSISTSSSSDSKSEGVSFRKHKSRLLLVNSGSSFSSDANCLRIFSLEQRTPKTNVNSKIFLCLKRGQFLKSTYLPNSLPTFEPQPVPKTCSALHFSVAFESYFFGGFRGSADRSIRQRTTRMTLSAVGLHWRPRERRDTRWYV